jgi:hypothetical protein
MKTRIQFKSAANPSDPNRLRADRYKKILTLAEAEPLIYLPAHDPDNLARLTCGKPLRVTAPDERR